LSFSLQDRVAVVTGASKGIGAGIAKTLAEAGATVVVNFSTDQQGADAVVSSIVAKGGKGIAVQGSVAKAAEVQHLFAVTKTEFGTLDILVNNAGVYSFGPIENLQEDEFHRQFNTNVLGPLLTVRESLNLSGPNGGSIINISAIAGTGRTPNMVVYAATKGALDSMTRVMAAELAPKKIRVNTVAPGATETEGIAAVGFSGARLEQAAAGVPLKRIGQPNDIGQAVLFLASDSSSFITGERIQVAGGQHF
jgi:3-oxoacyl-[acyl-carrier protein] reductase